MISRLISHSSSQKKSSIISLSSKSFVTHYEHLRYSIPYIPKKRPNTEFEIQPVTSKNMDLMAREGARIFSNAQAISTNINFTPEENYLFFYYLAMSNAQKNLGIACFEKESGEFAAAILNEDFFYPMVTPDLTPLEFQEESTNSVQKIEKVKELYGTFGKEAPQYYAKPSKPSEVIHLIAGLTSPKYTGLGIQTRLTRFMLQEHPIINKARLIVTEATYPGSQVAYERNGFKTVSKIAYKDFEFSNGEKIFPNFDKGWEKGVAPDDVKIMVYERKYA